MASSTEIVLGTVPGTARVPRAFFVKKGGRDARGPAEILRRELPRRQPLRYMVPLRISLGGGDKEKCTTLCGKTPAPVSSGRGSTALSCFTPTSLTSCRSQTSA